MKSLDLSAKLLDEAHVAVVPGEPFGSEKHIRVSFAISDDEIEEAVKRIAAWTKQAVA